MVGLQILDLTILVRIQAGQPHMKREYTGKWKLTLRVIPVVAVLVACKFIVHRFGGEFLSLNSLFGAIISANVFLVGFLISGVLVDYKESEKIPGELACSLEVLIDESVITYRHNGANVAIDIVDHVRELTTTIISWLHKKESTVHLLQLVSDLNAYFLELESVTQANFIVRLKNEQSIMRKLITRIHTIRETSFNPAGYAIAEIISSILCIGLIFTRIDPYYESVFFIAFVSFILIYMVMLIRDLDNPFGYYEKENYADEVSLKPLLDLLERIPSNLKK